MESPNVFQIMDVPHVYVWHQWDLEYTIYQLAPLSAPDGVVEIKRLMWSSSLHSQISQKKGKEITFSVEQDFVVTHPKPAPVQIYDYYETGKSLILSSTKFGGGTRDSKTLHALREVQNQPSWNQDFSELLSGSGFSIRGETYFTSVILCARW